MRCITASGPYIAMQPAWTGCVFRVDLEAWVQAVCRDVLAAGPSRRRVICPAKRPPAQSMNDTCRGRRRCRRQAADARRIEWDEVDGVGVRWPISGGPLGGPDAGT